MSYFITKERYSEAMINQEMIFSNNIGRLNNMLDACYEKCLKDKLASSLTKGDNLCIDRCSIKFFKMTVMIEDISKKKIEERKQQNIEHQQA
jgi:hypothetical protein